MHADDKHIATNVNAKAKTSCMISHLLSRCRNCVDVLHQRCRNARLACFNKPNKPPSMHVALLVANPPGLGSMIADVLKARHHAETVDGRKGGASKGPPVHETTMYCLPIEQEARLKSEYWMKGLRAPGLMYA